MGSLSRKAAHIWADRFSQRRSKVADYTRQNAEVAETTVKGLLFCGFRRTGKAMKQMLSMFVENMSRNKCFFPGSNITCFTF
jgi:hypothetical protein